MTAIGDIFTFTGRIGRLDFVRGLIAALVVGMVLQLPVLLVQRATTEPPPAIGQMATDAQGHQVPDPREAYDRRLRVERLLFALAVLAWPVTALHARRLRDLGRSPWFAGLIWLPVVGWALCAACAVLPTPGRHSAAPD